MLQKIFLILAVFSFVSTFVVAKENTMTKRDKKRQAKLRKQGKLKDTRTHCEKVKADLTALEAQQQKLQVIEGKAMPDLREELAQKLAKLTVLDGVQSLIMTHKRAMARFKMDIAIQSINIPKLLQSAGQVIDSRKELERVHKLTNGENSADYADWAKMKKNITAYKQKHCEPQGFTENVKDVFSNWIIPEEFTYACNQVEGLKQALTLIKGNDQKDMLIKQISVATEKALGKNTKSKKLINKMTSEIIKWTSDTSEEVKKMAIRKELVNEITASLLAESKVKIAKMNSEKFSTKKITNQKAKFETLLASARKKYPQIGSFDSELLKLCPNVTDPSKCLSQLYDKDIEQDIDTLKKEMQVINQNIINLKSTSNYSAIESAKQLIIGQEKKYCMPNIAETVYCVKLQDDKYELGSFLKLSNDLTIEVQNPKQTKKGTSGSKQKLLQLCKDNKMVKKHASSMCKTVKKQRSIVDEYKTKHIYYNKKGEKFTENRTSNTAIAVTALAQGLMTGLPQYLAIDNLEYQNEYLYNQAIIQKDMNYYNQLQFDWYMQNYSLYGTDPYSLNGGYDPYYTGTFQFGNTNYALYNGYYAY